MNQSSFNRCSNRIRQKLLKSSSISSPTRNQTQANSDDDYWLRFYKMNRDLSKIDEVWREYENGYGEKPSANGRKIRVKRREENGRKHYSRYLKLWQVEK